MKMMRGPAACCVAGLFGVGQSFGGARRNEQKSAPLSRGALSSFTHYLGWVRNDGLLLAAPADPFAPHDATPAVDSHVEAFAIFTGAGFVNRQAAVSVVNAVVTAVPQLTANLWKTLAVNATTDNSLEFTDIFTGFSVVVFVAVFFLAVVLLYLIFM